MLYHIAGKRNCQIVAQCFLTDLGCDLIYVFLGKQVL